MPYRPPKRAHPSQNGNGNRRRPSFATRRAIARSTARKPASRGTSVIVAAILVFVVGVVTVASAGAIAAGGAAAVTIAALDEGLPDVKAFQDLDFSQPTRIMDRKGKVELARVWNRQREVIKFDDAPFLVLDATTATEDDTFWQNPGIDLEATVNAFLSAAGGGSSRGGASTITQQLVRARLLPEDVTSNDTTSEGLYLRKAKELLQAYKLTQAFPGEDGKKAIITAYLNEVSYGAADGISAAAQLYLHKNLDELTLSEVALLAAIPQEPATLYPWAVNPRSGRYTNIVKETRGKSKRAKKRSARYYIKTCKEDDKECVPTELVARRDYILGRLRDGKGRWTQVSDEAYQEALKEKIRVYLSQPVVYKAPHFVNALIPELQLILADREPISRGGYKVITTMDMRAQNIAERVIAGGAVLPNLPPAQFSQQLSKLHLRGNAGWISRLRGSNLRNGALIAEDYRTGDILAYVGSAGYYRKETPRFAPKVDHLGGSHRQPGSAWKPILYASGIDTERLTAGTYLLDKREAFGPGWTPQNADHRYRGLIRVRDAIQQSLNIPAIRALQKTGITTVRRYAVKAGFTFLNGNNRMLDQAGLAGALGTVEVRPIDMTTAFGAFGNGGKVTKPRYILKVLGPNGEVIYQAGKPATEQVWKPATAYIMADILSGNTSRAINPAWGAVFEMHNTRDGSRRVAAVKTGTTNELKDYSTYGFLPMPRNKKDPALAVGVWYGNSDSSSPNLGLLHYSLDNAGQTWVAFVREYMNNKPAPTFQRPKGVVAGPGGELYVTGTQPGGKHQVDTAPPPVTTNDDRSDEDNGSGSGSGDGNKPTTPRRRGGGGSNGGGGEPKPAPTCRPGSTNVPKGCVIPLD